MSILVHEIARTNWLKNGGIERGMGLRFIHNDFSKGLIRITTKEEENHEKGSLIWTLAEADYNDLILLMDNFKGEVWWVLVDPDGTNRWAVNLRMYQFPTDQPRKCTVEGREKSRYFHINMKTSSAHWTNMGAIVAL